MIIILYAAYVVWLNPVKTCSVTLSEVCSSEFYEIFLNSFFTKQLWVSATSHFTRSCLYEKNYPTQVRRLTWVRSRPNGVFHFVKTNLLYEKGLIPPRWDLTSPQVRSHLGGIIFLHVNSFCRAVPPRQYYSFSLVSVWFCDYYMKKCCSSYKFSSVDVY